jgi:hypothetical protein
MTDTAVFPAWILDLVYTHEPLPIGEFCPRERGRVEDMIDEGYLISYVDDCGVVVVEIGPTALAV